MFPFLERLEKSATSVLRVFLRLSARQDVPYAVAATSNPTLAVGGRQNDRRSRALTAPISTNPHLPVFPTDRGEPYPAGRAARTREPFVNESPRIYARPADAHNSRAARHSRIALSKRAGFAPGGHRCTCWMKPSSGLHAADVDRLLGCCGGLGRRQHLFSSTLSRSHARRQLDGRAWPSEWLADRSFTRDPRRPCAKQARLREYLSGEKRIGVPSARRPRCVARREWRAAPQHQGDRFSDPARDITW